MNIAEIVLGGVDAALAAEAKTAKEKERLTLHTYRYFNKANHHKNIHCEVDSPSPTRAAA